MRYSWVAHFKDRVSGFPKSGIPVKGISGLYRGYMGIKGLGFSVFPNYAYPFAGPYNTDYSILGVPPFWETTK